jgi:hypothetical protein
LAVLSFVVTLAQLCWAMQVLIRGGTISRLPFWLGALISQFVDWPALSVIPLVLPSAGAYLSLALLYLAIGAGLWRLQNWARWLLIIRTAFELVAAAIGFASPHFPFFRQTTIAIAINVAILIYLFRADAKQVFGTSGV